MSGVAPSGTTPRVSQYTIDAPPYWEHEQITVTATGDLHGRLWVGTADVWAVRRRGWCLNRDGEWEYEPQPSSRDDEFFVRCRWTLGEALAAAQAAMDAWCRENAARIADHLDLIGAP